MTSKNLNIVLTNAICCSSNLAIKVSKLLSMGNFCAESEVIKLKLLNDSIEVLKCFTANDNLTEDKINQLIKNVMLQCNICECQLNQE